MYFALSIPAYLVWIIVVDAYAKFSKCDNKIFF